MHISRWGEGKTSSVNPASEYRAFQKELFQQFKHVRLVTAKAECCRSISYKVQANLARSAQADTAEAQNFTRTPTRNFRKQRKTVRGLEETFI